MQIIRSILLSSEDSTYLKKYIFHIHVLHKVININTKYIMEASEYNIHDTDKHFMGTHFVC